MGFDGLVLELQLATDIHKLLPLFPPCLNLTFYYVLVAAVVVMGGSVRSVHDYLNASS